MECCVLMFTAHDSTQHALHVAPVKGTYMQQWMSCLARETHVSRAPHICAEGVKLIINNWCQLQAAAGAAPHCDAVCANSPVECSM
jgi:hypothetical protein